jgi:hypothetical protein
LPEDRFNVFQRLARTWDAVHPYNAAQACLIAGSFDETRLKKHWTDVEVRTLELNEDLSRHFTVELNRPFDRCSFRPFVQPCQAGTWLGIVYRHRVADNISIREMMQAWAARVMGLSERGRSPASRKPAEGFGVNALLQLIRRYDEHRRVRKVHTMGPLDYAVRVRVLDDLRGVSPRALLSYARSHGVTLNDVLVAALAEACGRRVPVQHRAGRRDLAVSSIVDLRPYLADEADRLGFGCHLGFSGVVCRERELLHWLRLLQVVARQNRLERDGKHGPPGMWWMHAAAIATRFVRPDRLYDFYRKEAPFAGGLSNVKLNDTWFAEQHAAGRVLDYVRVSPTGPMVPIALNVTSLGEHLRLSMTYRWNLMNDWTAGELAEMFVRRVRWAADAALTPAAGGGR